MDVKKRIERWFDHHAVKGLMSYIVYGNALVCLLGYFDRRGVLPDLLKLDPAAVLRGEIWRLASFVLIPPPASPLFVLLALYFYHLIGTALEREWGSARFNLYYLAGMAGTALGAFITGAGATSFYLNLSLFLAFARLFPDFEFRLLLVLPVKAKYLAWLDWGFLGFSLLVEDWPAKVAVLASVFNFFLFFGGGFPAHLHRQRLVSRNRRRFLEALEDTPPRRICAVCGRSDKSHPRMVFRTCRLCGLDRDYCEDHLDSHRHVADE